MHYILTTYLHIYVYVQISFIYIYVCACVHACVCVHGDRHIMRLQRTACMVHASTQQAMHALQEANVATAMCEDMALLGSTNLIKHSRWNRHLGAQVCLCRISQVSCFDRQAHHT